LDIFRYIRYLLLVIFLLASSLFVKAQIKIESTNVQDWIKNNFAGQGLVIGNINVNLAGKEAIGVFSNNGVLQINEGLVISTGDIKTIAGINNKYNQSTRFNNTGKPEYDNDLAKIIKSKLYDISFIEFDFVPYNNSIEFNYQFGSDEYPEYVGSAFNDIFAFFISDSLESKNIALVPNKNIPVSVNTINHLKDSAFYINNNVFEITSRYAYKPKTTYGGSTAFKKKSKVGELLQSIKSVIIRKKDYNIIQPPLIKESEQLISLADKNLYQNLQFDGITKKLVAQTYVEPYKKYHLKIIIADVSDNVYDSAVFLEKGSLITKKDLQQPNFKDYPNLIGQINPEKILQGQKITSIEQPIKSKTAPKEKMEVNLPIIYFDFDSFNIKESEVSKILDFVKVYQNNIQGYDFILEGHTDNKGNLDYNYILSQKRSLAVLEYVQSLIKEKITISIKSDAYLKPLETNRTQMGRAKNRRVELVLKKK
jgi:outer membrane protein OmpA-like peptidoglycan-associated protein